MMLGKLGVRNFWLQRRRNLFVLIAIAIGVSGLISLGGYIDRWEHSLRNDVIYLHGHGMLSIYKKDGWLMNRSLPKKFSLDRDDRKTIEDILGKMEGIEKVGPILNSNGLLSNGCRSQPFEVRGYDIEVDRWMREKDEVKRWCGNLLSFSSGRSFAATPGSGPLIGLAKGLASLIGKKAVKGEGSPSAAPITSLSEYCKGPGAAARIAADPNVQVLGISFDGHFNAVDADLAHTFSTGTKVSEDTQMTAPLTLVQDLFQTESVSSLAVYLYDYRQADAKSKELERLFREAGLTYDIHVWHEPELSHFYHGVMNFMQAMNIFCSLLIGSVVFLSVVNLTTMNVLQRSREMGTLKALGFGSSAISKIFIIEATVLAFLGCLAGGGLSLFISSIVNRLDIMYTPPGFSAAVVFLLLPNPLTIASVLALVFVLVLVAAAVTVGVLARRSCLQLLTHNG